jgi:hypothetical protein
VVTEDKTKALQEVHRALKEVDIVCGRYSGVPFSFKAIDNARAIYLSKLREYREIDT